MSFMRLWVARWDERSRLLGPRSALWTGVMRTATLRRDTSETRISVSVDLDGTGQYDIHTGVGFFDHMLEQLARHSLIDVTLHCDGDLHIDQHHTVEDSALALGSAVAQ